MPNDPQPSNPDFRFFICTHIGLAGTTPVTIKQSAEGFEARIGIALFGSTNMDEEGFKATGWNPFHELFHDNYAEGKGATQEEAIAEMEKDFKSIHESLLV